MDVDDIAIEELLYENGYIETVVVNLLLHVSNPDIVLTVTVYIVVALA